MVEVVDTPDLGSGTARCGGSSPPFRTISFQDPQVSNDIMTACITGWGHMRFGRLESEEVLLTHPGVSGIAVLGVPDPKWGTSGVALIVLPGEGASAEARSGFLQDQLPRYTPPQCYFFWDEHSKSGYDKGPKHLIRTQLHERGDLVKEAGT